MVQMELASALPNTSKRHDTRPHSNRRMDAHVGEALAFALKAALEGGPALAAVLTVGIRGARDSMIASPTTVETYLSVCDTVLRLLETPSAKQLQDFVKLLNDIMVCARGVSRATRQAAERSPWSALAERASELLSVWGGQLKAQEERSTMV